MANVTYYIGAGASAGKRDKQGEIIEGLPCVNEVTKRLGRYVNRIAMAAFHEGERDWNTPYPGLGNRAEWEAAKQRLVSNLRKLHTACERNATIDTYAKKLVLQEKKAELEHLERLLSFYFILEQVMCQPDRRYDTFLANILQNRRQFPSNIKVLSWNYDSQFEIAYDEYDSEHVLNIGSKQSTKYQKFDILKINGSASFRGAESIQKYRSIIRPSIEKRDEANQSGGIYNDPIEDILPDLVYLYQMYVGEINPTVENNTNLSFAFDYNKPSDILFQRAKEIISNTEVLVVIGYTFPFFNREIDREILDILYPDADIYIQDYNPERIRQSFLAVCPNIDSSNIHLLNEVDQFFLPPQL